MDRWTELRNQVEALRAAGTGEEPPDGVVRLSFRVMNRTLDAILERIDALAPIAEQPVQPSTTHLVEGMQGVLTATQRTIGEIIATLRRHDALLTGHEEALRLQHETMGAMVATSRATDQAIVALRPLIETICAQLAQQGRLISVLANWLTEETPASDRAALRERLMTCGPPD